jgi:hypothetical protein
MQPGQIFSPQNQHNDEELILAEPKPQPQNNGEVLPKQISIRKRRLFIVPGLLLIVLAVASALFFIFSSKVPTSQNVIDNNSHDERSSKDSMQPSIFDFFALENTVGSATINLTPYATESVNILPPLHGELSQSTESTFSTKFVINVALAKQKLDELAARNTDIPIDRDSFEVTSTYQLDFQGLLNKLGFLYTSNSESILDSVQQHIGEISPQCKTEIKNASKESTNYISSLKPDFIDAGNNLSKWEVDVAAMTKLQHELSDSLEQECYGSIRMDEGLRNANLKRQLVLSKLTEGDKTTLSIEYDRGVVVKPTLNKIATIELTNINATDKKEVFSGPSLFSPQHFNEFVVMISECNDYPIIATNFAASYSYITPDNIEEYNPIYASTYFCTENEAKSQGFHNIDV